MYTCGGSDPRKSKTPARSAVAVFRLIYTRCIISQKRNNYTQQPLLAVFTQAAVNPVYRHAFA